MQSHSARKARTGPRSLLAALALIVVALAGCNGTNDTSESSAIRIENAGPEGGPGPYTFTADVASENDNYTWDLGDRLTVLYGKSVTHTYDLKNANLSVTLRVREAGAQQVYSTPLKLGTGINAPAGFALDAETNWAVIGTPVKFSAFRSVDPDQDPFRFSWTCLVTVSDEKLVFLGAHPPHGGGGTPYATPPAGSVVSYTANYTLPPADTVLQGDMCDALPGGARASTNAMTIEGTFTKRGMYKIFLLATDGAHPTVSGSYDFYVTRPDEKPPEWQSHWFNKTLLLGGGGVLQGQCGAIPNGQACDSFTGNFSVPLTGVVGYINVTFDAGAASANNVTWELRRNDGLVVARNCPDATTKQPGACANPDRMVLGPDKLAPGNYALTATLQRGGSTNVTMQVAVQHSLNPFSIY